MLHFQKNGAMGSLCSPWCNVTQKGVEGVYDVIKAQQYSRL